MKKSTSETSVLLCSWYLKNKRDLPWRRTKNPYSIWLSEVMLQQTTVKAVIPYFEKFLNKFPTVERLAHASTDEVFSLWSGLGYYSRARNLHKAAKQITELGQFPKCYSELIQLSGIGPYTAAAIASIAFGEKVAVVDGNVIRVISRLFDLKDDISQKTTQFKIQKLATDLMGHANPSDFNQSVMELGATVCVPKNPACLICPVTKKCQAFKNGTTALRPVKSKKTKLEPWIWRLQLAFKKGKIALVKNNNGTPWLKDTWVIPGAARKAKTKPKKWDLKHSITKHNIFVVIDEAPKNGPNWTWVKLEEVDSLGVSSIVQKVLKTKKAMGMMEAKMGESYEKNN